METPTQVLNDTNQLKNIVIAGAVAIAIALGLGFWGGLKFADTKLAKQVAGYDDQIKKLNTNIATKDVAVQQHITVEVQKTQEAQTAKKETVIAIVKADTAIKAYNQLKASIKDPTPDVVAVENNCDEVIATKDDVIKGLNLTVTNVFDAKTAADQVIAGLQSEKTDYITQTDLQNKINNDLRKEVESQDRRKWLYLVGGAIIGAVADHAKGK